MLPPSLICLLSPHRIELIGEELQANQLSRKTLFYLVSTLNASFNPDYDFSSCGSDEFSKEPSIKVSSLPASGDCLSHS